MNAAEVVPFEVAGPLPAPVAATYQLQGGQTVIPWDSPQTVVQFAQPGIPMSDPDYFYKSSAGE